MALLILDERGRIRHGNRAGASLYSGYPGLILPRKAGATTKRIVVE